MISLVLHIGSLRTNWSLKMSLNFDLLWKHLTHWRLLSCFWAIWQLWCLTSCQSYIKNTLYRCFWSPGSLQILNWASGGIFFAVPSLTQCVFRCASPPMQKFHNSGPVLAWNGAASSFIGLWPACAKKTGGSCCSLCCILQYFPHLHCQSILESYWGHHLNFCCGEFQSLTVSCVTPGDIFLCSRYLRCVAQGESYSSTGQLEVQLPWFTSCLVLWGGRMGLLVPLIVGITIILDVSVH